MFADIFPYLQRTPVPDAKEFSGGVPAGLAGFMRTAISSDSGVERVCPLLHRNCPARPLSEQSLRRRGNS